MAPKLHLEAERREPGAGVSRPQSDRARKALLPPPERTSLPLNHHG